MEKQKEKIDLRFVVRVCPSCKREFDDAEHQICPDDESLLCPVGQAEFIGQHIGHFEVLSKIGSGSSSTVYLGSNDAHDLKVAIKILDASLQSDAEAAKRFQKEAETIQSLNNPLIPSLHEFGLLPDGRPYLIMDYVDGTTLKDLLESKGKLEPAQALDVFLCVIEALQAAHGCGILHRDIKPSNIMIATDGKVRVVDFGVAKVTGIETTTTVTRTGMVIGTPAYMSPEQCKGEQFDVRSEIYSLGCVMYECLSGQKVFSAENVFNCMHQHTFDEPPSLSKLVPNLSETIELSIMACLAKDPADRFQTMNDLKAALRGEGDLAVHKAKSRMRSTRRRPTRSPIAPYLLPLLVVAIGVALTLVEHRLEKTSESMKTPPVVSSSSYTPPPAETIEIPQDGPKKAEDFLKDQFSEMERGISFLDRHGQSAKATEFRTQLAGYKRLLNGPLPDPALRQTEVHVVEGDSGTLQENHPPFDASVKVTYSGNPVELLLLNTNPTNWHVECAPGVKIAKVVMQGFKDSKVIGLPSTVPIETQFGNAPITLEEFGDHVWEIANNLQPEGQKFVGFAVCHPERSSTAALLGPENREWRAQHIIWRMRDFHKSVMAQEARSIEEALKEIRFDGIYIISNAADAVGNKLATLVPHNPGHDVNRTNSSCIMDAIDATVNLPVFAGVRTENAKDWYLIARDGLIFYDALRESYTSVPVPPPLPDLSFCTGITRDTKRNRILVLSVEFAKNSNDVEQTVLYAFDPVAKLWSTVARYPKIELNSLAYSAADDTIYTLILAQSWDKAADNSYFAQLSSAGTRMKVTKISKNISRYPSVYPPTIQLNVVDRFLLATFHSERHNMANWAIDRFNGDVLRKP